MSATDHSRYYEAGAKALKRLAARCGEARLAKIFETQAERFLLMAGVCERKADAPEPAPPVVAAKRPVFSPRGLPERRTRSANVVDLSTRRELRGR